MTIPTHLMAGLVLGKLTGNYVLSVGGGFVFRFGSCFLLC